MLEEVKATQTLDLTEGACDKLTDAGLKELSAICQPKLGATRAEQALGSESVPSGANIIVCIAAFGGFNQEDSLILNKASVERGLFRTLCHRSMVEGFLRRYNLSAKSEHCGTRMKACAKATA